MDEFWSLSPAQTMFAFRALGLTKRKGKASDLLAVFRGVRGVEVERVKE